jgi:hypothetical protein
MTTTTHSISPLRQRMLDDMRLRKLALKTQGQYIRAVKNFTRFLKRSPDTATAEDLRRYQLETVSTGVSATTINATITGLRFLFEVTLEQPDTMKRMHPVSVERKLPTVLSREEVTRLLQNAPSIKYQAALSVAYGAGLRASEVAWGLRSAISIASVCSCALRRARAVKSATPSSRLDSINSCAIGGAMRALRERCYRAGGCFRDSIPSMRCRLASSTAPAMPRWTLPRLISASRCTRCAILRHTLARAKGRYPRDPSPART